MFFTVLAVLLCASSALAKDTYVNGYVKKDGTYVQPHYRAAPNSTTYDNYSTKGNINPYTWEKGTVDPERDRDESDSGDRDR